MIVLSLRRSEWIEAANQGTFSTDTPLIHSFPGGNSLQNVGGGLQRASNSLVKIADGATALLSQVIRIKTTGKPDSTLGADMCALLETA